MWKNSQAATSSVSALPELPPSTPVICAVEPNTHSALLAKQQSVVGPGLILVGEISGMDSLSSLFIEGTIEGNINLPATHVTVGRGGQVNAGILARNIVISGTIVGNITASDRLEIRAGGSLTGDASARRITIADGAFIQGNILVTSNAQELAAATQLTSVETKARKPVGIRPEIQTAAQTPIQAALHGPIMVPAFRSA